MMEIAIIIALTFLLTQEARRIAKTVRSEKFEIHKFYIEWSNRSEFANKEGSTESYQVMLKQQSAENKE